MYLPAVDLRFDSVVGIVLDYGAEASDVVTETPPPKQYGYGRAPEFCKGAIDNAVIGHPNIGNGVNAALDRSVTVPSARAAAGIDANDLRALPCPAWNGQSSHSNKSGTA
jgi:hypothetical protein